MDLWEDYTTKGNNFADWLTGLIISNFVYLVGFAKEKTGLWCTSFFAALVALILVFIFKSLGVWAAKMRVDAGHTTPPEKNIESARDIISAFFVVLGALSMILSGIILVAGLFGPSH